MAKDYYNGNDCFEAMGSVLTPEELRGFCVGNAFKYIWRHHGKGGREDLEKAVDYLERALDIMKDEDSFSWARAVMAGEHGRWIKRRNGYVCSYCGAQTHELTAICYNCGASMDEPNDSDDRPVNVGKTGTWVAGDKIDGAKYGCPFCGQTVTFKDEDIPEVLTCPRCLATLGFREADDENDV